MQEFQPLYEAILKGDAKTARATVEQIVVAGSVNLARKW
jgi:DNA-binding FadR family transcriptional regulator